MHIVIYSSQKVFDVAILGGLAKGAAVRGHKVTTLEKYTGVVPGTDLAVVRGVAGGSRRVMDEYLAAGKYCAYVDKGYTRVGKNAVTGMEYLKVSLNSFQPLKYLMDIPQSAKRWESVSARFGLSLAARRDGCGTILYSGPSAKNARFHGLGDPTRYAQSLVAAMQQVTDKPIVYRPKQSWDGAVPVDGASFSRLPEKFSDVLAAADCMVVHNSNSSVEAILAGVPVTAFGPAITQPVAGRTLQSVHEPFWAPLPLREQWIANVCWWQWTVEELIDGTTWRFLERYL